MGYRFRLVTELLAALRLSYRLCLHLGLNIDYCLLILRYHFYPPASPLLKYPPTASAHTSPTTNTHGESF